jgi:hypothetical protein
MDGIIPIIFILLVLAGAGSFLLSVILGVMVIVRKFETSKAFYISASNSFIVLLASVISLFFSNTGIGIVPFIVLGVLFLTSILISYKIAKRSNVTWYK